MFSDFAIVVEPPLIENSECEVFIKIVLLVSFMTLLDTSKNLRYLELFAGRARLTRLARSLGFAAEAHDIIYDQKAMKEGCNNAMDITTEAGFLFLNSNHQWFPRVLKGFCPSPYHSYT